MSAVETEPKSATGGYAPRNPVSPPLTAPGAEVMHDPVATLTCRIGGSKHGFAAVVIVGGTVPARRRQFGGAFTGIMNKTSRPLSPHLQIYRPQITSVLSILHRITGVALAIGTFLLIWWLVAAASGREAFEAADGFMASWLGRLLLFGWTFALFFHLCNGIRHLAWDAGRGFELKTVSVTGWLAVGAAVALTIISWIAGYSIRG